MKQDQDQAFIDTPPEELLPFSQKTILLINRALTKAGLDMESLETLGAYFAISKGNLKPSADEIEEMFNSLSDEQVDAATAYINRVVGRRDAGQVRIESEPGK